MRSGLVIWYRGHCLGLFSLLETIRQIQTTIIQHIVCRQCTYLKTPSHLATTQTKWLLTHIKKNKFCGLDDFRTEFVFTVSWGAKNWHSYQSIKIFLKAINDHPQHRLNYSIASPRYSAQASINSQFVETALQHKNISSLRPHRHGHLGA